MKIDIHKEVEIESTIRTELLSSMFEVPAKTKLSVTLTGEVPLDRDYNIGLIVGPSGCGKTILLETIFGKPERLSWGAKSVIDDFPSICSMEDISRVCQAVGFNTIPSWLRPFSVLSNGEQFRVEVARRLLDVLRPIYMDEFTSVVDRQVAQFACHAIQKYVREKSKRLVVASCHYDIINWLQPDWILEPGNPCRFTWRSLRQRPSINVSIQRVKYETWQLFKDFHYMSQDLNKAARCYGLYVEEIRRPVSTGIEAGVSRFFKESNDVNSKEPDEQFEAFIPAEFSSGMGIGFHDDDLQTSQDGSESLLGTSPTIRIPSSGCDGSGGDGDSDSELLVSERRSPSDDGSMEDKSDGCSDTVYSSATSSKVISSKQSSNSSRDECDVSTAATKLQKDVYENSLGGRRPLRCSEREHLEPTYRIASMCGVLYRPHPRVSDIYGFTRMVTLPDFQGLGLAFVLACKIGSAYKALGKRLHSYPNHPAWIRSYQRSPLWLEVKSAGEFSPKRGKSSSVSGFGGRRCAVYFYVGPPMNRDDAERLISGE